MVGVTRGADVVCPQSALGTRRASPAIATAHRANWFLWITECPWNHRPGRLMTVAARLEKENQTHPSTKVPIPHVEAGNVLRAGIRPVDEKLRGDPVSKPSLVPSRDLHQRPRCARAATQ